MKLAVFGATGGVGRRLVARAIAAGHEVAALTRAPSHAPHVIRARLVTGDVRDSRAVETVLDGAEAVLSCLGSPLARTFARGGRIAAPGTGRIVDAMRAQAIRRIVALSTYGAGESVHALTWPAWLMMHSLLRGELADKNTMEELFRRSDLDWTVLRPANLSDAPGTGRWRAHEKPIALGFGDRIARDDVAACMLAMSADSDSIGRAFVVVQDKD